MRTEFRLLDKTEDDSSEEDEETEQYDEEEGPAVKGEVEAGTEGGEDAESDDEDGEEYDDDEDFSQEEDAAPVAKPKGGQTAADAAGEMPEAGITKKQRPTAQHLVDEAIRKLDDRTGSSLRAIMKYIAANHDVDPQKFNKFVKKYMRGAVESGRIIRKKGIGLQGSFKLSDKLEKIEKKGLMMKKNEQLKEKAKKLKEKEKEQKRKMKMEAVEKKKAKIKGTKEKTTSKDATKKAPMKASKTGTAKRKKDPLAESTVVGATVAAKPKKPKMLKPVEPTTAADEQDEDEDDEESTAPPPKGKQTKAKPTAKSTAKSKTSIKLVRKSISLLTKSAPRKLEKKKPANRKGGKASPKVMAEPVDESDVDADEVATETPPVVTATAAAVKVKAGRPKKK